MSKKYSTYEITIKGKKEKFQGRFNDNTSMYEVVYKGVTGWGSSLEEALSDAVNEYQSI